MADQAKDAFNRVVILFLSRLGEKRKARLVYAWTCGRYIQGGWRPRWRGFRVPRNEVYWPQGKRIDTVFECALLHWIAGTPLGRERLCVYAYQAVSSTWEIERQVHHAQYDHTTHFFFLLRVRRN